MVPRRGTAAARRRRRSRGFFLFGETCGGIASRGAAAHDKSVVAGHYKNTRVEVLITLRCEGLATGVMGVNNLRPSKRYGLKEHILNEKNLFTRQKSKHRFVGRIQPATIRTRNEHSEYNIIVRYYCGVDHGNSLQFDIDSTLIIIPWNTLFFCSLFCSLFVITHFSFFFFGNFHLEVTNDKTHN